MHDLLPSSDDEAGTCVVAMGNPLLDLAGDRAEVVPPASFDDRAHPA
jgi:hypothetical protein